MRMIYPRKKNTFRYFLDPDIMRSFYQGNSFDREEFYTIEEKNRLDGDIRSLYDSIVHPQVLQEKVALIAAGAPGAGKATLIKQNLYLKKNSFAYICPDDVCLKSMKSTFLKELNESLNALGENATNDEILQVRQRLYNKWRPASNAAAHLILANVIRQGYSLCFGTTSTPPTSVGFYQFLKKQGYTIHLIHVTAKDEVRWKSVKERDTRFVKERDTRFVQTTKQDVLEKGFLFAQRLQDTYLKYADRIDFYYRDKYNESAVRGATWIKLAEKKLESKNEGILTVVSQPAYEKIQEVHDGICSFLGREDLFWSASFQFSQDPYSKGMSGGVCVCTTKP